MPLYPLPRSFWLRRLTLLHILSSLVSHGQLSLGIEADLVACLREEVPPAHGYAGWPWHRRQGNCGLGMLAAVSLTTLEK